MSDNEDNPPAKRTKFNIDDIQEDNANLLPSINLKQELESNCNSNQGIESNCNSNQGIELNSKSYNDLDEASNKYEFVCHDELQKLREFKVLDEVNEEDSKDEDSDSSGKSEELPEDEIEKMLEEDLPEDYKGAPKPKEKNYVTRAKIVLEEKGINHFEVLPLDWLMVRHCSGMPVYMHRSTRVCTLSKPYFLGKGNTRRHDIPISAIPCLSYRKALEEEEEQRKIDESIAEQIKTGTWVNNDNDKDKRLNKTADNTKISDKTTDNVNTINADNDILSNKISDNDKTSDQISGEEKKSEETANNEISDKTAYKGSNNNSNENKEIDIVMKPATNSIQNEINDVNEIKNLNETVNPDQTETELKSEASMKANNVENKSNEDSSQENEGQAPSCPFKKDGPSRKPVVLPGGIVMPPPRVEEVNTSWKSQHLSSEQLNDYCKRLFRFKTVNIMHFKRWADRRRYTKTRKALQYPALPEGTKLITIPAQAGPGTAAGKPTKRDWVMNMNGCSYLSVFHEYVRRALQKQPVYEFKQLENAASPYQATVYIGGMQYGSGRGSSKRQAKSAAARASIHILIPEMKDELEDQLEKSTAQPDPDFSFFDYVGIEDPRVQEFSAAAAEPSPHAILRTCLLRNCGAGDRHIHTEMKKLEYQKISLTMKVGKHSATVVCKNKKQAKQAASQSILQALHPHIKSWGSLLRLYGSRSVKSCKERKLEEQQITLLQDQAQHHAPNYAVLDKLRHEMTKLRERDEAVVPIGTLLLAEDLPSHSGSNLNNVDL